MDNAPLPTTYTLLTSIDLADYAIVIINVVTTQTFLVPATQVIING